jgi:pyruvate/2-oxoglutarate dehydrogenase complex dihydrolipoamide acyltransferase (E2) component
MVDKVHKIKPRKQRRLQFFPTAMPIPVTIPKATITMEEANIVGWRKRPGDAVLKDEILFEMETDKVIMEVAAPASGILLRIDIADGVVKLDWPVAWIGQAGESIPDVSQTQEVSLPQSTAIPSITVAAAGHISSPAARRRARELGIDIALAHGTGPGGRVTEADVEKMRGPS